MARWVLSDEQPQPNTHILGAIIDNRVIGHIALEQRPLEIPASAWSKHQTAPIMRADGTPLSETFVSAFGVEMAHRRQGYGRALQQAALAHTKSLGCYQMRSWSSLDKPANYALKLSLNFAIYPAIQASHSGEPISGVYFIKTV